MTGRARCVQTSLSHSDSHQTEPVPGVRSWGLAPACVLVGVWAQTLVATTSRAMPARALQTACMVMSFLHGGDCVRSLCRIRMHAIRSPFLRYPEGVCLATSHHTRRRSCQGLPRQG